MNIFGSMFDNSHEMFQPGLKAVAIAILFLILIVPIATYALFAKDLGSKESIINRNNTGLVLLDRNNKPFFNFYQGKQKTIIPLSSIPKNVQHAAIASEDREFYQHPGFSIKGIIRSIFVNVEKGGLSQGGSTLTQQLVKNALLNPKKNFLRKYQEIVLASEIERRYSKDEILEMYLNSVYFGEGAFGIEEAAKTYFNKPASQLTLAESAVLIGILPAPSALSPISNDPAKAKRQQEIVLGEMLEEKYITATEKAAAEKQKLEYQENKEEVNLIAPHFALMVKQQLIDKYGEEEVARSGYVVKTTLNRDWQEYAETTVKNQVLRLKGNDVSNGAAVVLDPKTGEILVLVGSADWYDEENGKVNMALRPRQPGSSFKPIVYGAAIEKQIITSATVIRDEEKVFPGNYKPKNYDGKFRGDVLVRRALANSLNIPAIEVLSRLGIDNALEAAQRLGITTLTDASNYGLSLVLGSGEVPLIQMTEAFGVFANEGKKVKPTSILEITDKSEKKIYSYEPSSESVFDDGAAYIISSILSDNSARAEVFGNALTISRPAAVKTGTTDDYRDSLTLGYTPSLVTGVWVGNNDNTPMDRVAGSLGAAPIWRLLMERFLAGTPVEQFREPAGVKKESICRDKGLLVKEATSSAYMEVFKTGTEPTQLCYVPLPTSNPTPSPEQNRPTDRPTEGPRPTQEPEPTKEQKPTKQIDIPTLFPTNFPPSEALSPTP